MSLLSLSTTLFYLLLFITLPLRLSAILSAGKYEPRHSLTPPFAPNQHPLYWSIGAATQLNQTSIRLTPPRPQRTGYVWNTVPVLMTDWEVEVEFQINGLALTGGDGFALWFTQQPELLGTVYGSTDYWIGLGLMFDTYNNDGIGASPSIAAVWNDGTQRYDHASDGMTQALASCDIDFRNTRQPAIARIRFTENTLIVDVSVTRSVDGQPRWEKCMNVANLDLGVDKYFGLTAHTADAMPDETIIYSVKTTDFTPSDADLAAARKHWSEFLDESQHKEGHQEMDQQHFQHTVLTIINQMQESLNLIEMNQLTMSDFLYNQKPMGVAGVAPGGTPSEDFQKPLPVPSTAAEQKLDQMTDLLQDALKDIRTLQTSVQTLQQSASSSSRSASVVDPHQAALQRTINSAESNVAQLKDSQTSLHRKVDELTRSVATLTSNPPTAQLSWSAGLMLLSVTLCSGLVAFMQIMNHRGKERYKII